MAIVRKLDWTRRAGAAFVLSTLISPTALAGDATQDQAAARALFEQGRELAKKGDYASACPKFEDSRRLEPGMGAVFNLADCYEHIGKTASAWALFLEVAADARKSGQADRETAARDRAALLKPKLSNLVVKVTDDSLQGLEVKRDGTELGRATWGAAVPVDPGKHAVEASAPGKKKWSSDIDVPAGPGSTELSVPTLLAAPPGEQAAPSAEAAAPSAAGREKPSGTRKTVSLVIGGAGVVAFGVGTVLALGARSKFKDGTTHCNGDACDPQGVALRHDAVARGNVATVVGGIGLAALATGVVLYLTAPSQTSSPQASILLAPGAIAVGGAW